MTGETSQQRRRIAATTGSLEELTGPFYDTAGLQDWLDLSPHDLDSRVREDSVLALTTGDGARVYPAWQWRADKTTVPHLAKVLTLLLTTARDPWTVALWMVSPVDWGDGRALPAWKWLAEDHDPTPVLEQARADAARWTG